MTEFDLYCHNKSAEGRRRLAAVRDIILAVAPKSDEGRVHFYLVVHKLGGTIAKLHLDAKEQVVITIPTGSDLQDPGGLLKGKAPRLAREIKITSDAYLTKHRDAIADLVRQALVLILERFADSTTPLTTLRPDQPSP